MEPSTSRTKSPFSTRTRALYLSSCVAVIPSASRSGACTSCHAASATGCESVRGGAGSATGAAAWATGRSRRAARSSSTTWRAVMSGAAPPPGPMDAG